LLSGFPAEAMASANPFIQLKYSEAVISFFFRLES
jgi:hypothetical protein